MPKPGRIVYVVRHAERMDTVHPEWLNTAERPYDPPLTPRGLRQALAVGKYMKKTAAPTVVITSPFTRCVETALQISSVTGARVVVEKGLSEYLKAAWFPSGNPLKHLPNDSQSSLSFDAGSLVDPSNKTIARPEYPESMTGMAARYARVIEGLTKVHRNEDIAIVTHGFGVQSMTTFFDRYADVSDCGFCCVSKAVKQKKGWELELCADDSVASAVRTE